MAAIVDRFTSKIAMFNSTRDEKIQFAHSCDQPTTSSDAGNLPKSGSASCNGLSKCGQDRSTAGVDKPKITAWDAGWNVSNAIQGMFVLGLPYAVLHGGYLGLLLIIVTAVVCCYTGNILIECLYEINPAGEKVRIRSTYVDVAAFCWGKHLGGYLVNAAQLIELVMTCVLYVVVSGNLMLNSFPHGPIGEAGWSVLACLVLFPCMFLRHLRAVSRLSMGCSVAQIVVLGITIIYCVTKIDTWAWGEITFSVDMRQFPVSIGVIVFSYTSQIFLPSLEGSMENRGEFRSMLSWSYVASCVTKATFALVCFLTWSKDTKDVVTDNLPPTLRALINVLLVVKALLSYPLPYYQAIEVMEQEVFKGATGGWGALLGTKRHAYNEMTEDTDPIMQSTGFNTDTMTSPSSTNQSEDGLEDQTRMKNVILTLDDPTNNKSSCPSCYSASGDLQIWALVLRGGLVLGTLLMGVFIPHFALLMGLTGSLTGTSLAFLFPCAFHIQIKWNEMRWREVALDAFIFISGCLCGITGIYFSIVGLYDVYNPTELSGALDVLNGTFNSTNKGPMAPNFFPDFPVQSSIDFPALIEPPIITDDSQSAGISKKSDKNDIPSSPFDNFDITQTASPLQAPAPLRNTRSTGSLHRRTQR
uniref:Vesicular inhibitory amino acid transporter n=1 Tax=Ciona savignyi TaxID=51511 RepID=H2ZJK5_CIOSA